MLDTRFIRAHFPALRDDVALFDNAGGSVPAATVIDRVADYMRHYGVQLGASYPQSLEAQALVTAGKAAAARLVNADPDEIVLSGSSTQLVRNLSRALRDRFEPGDEIVVTNLDHECNIGAWREFAETGVTIREWRFDPETQQLTMAGLESVLSTRTKLVAFTHCSNIVGAIHDAAAFIARIHQAGALACVDGVAYAPHRRVDVRALDADFYFLSLYKVFGPHQAMLFGKREHWNGARSLNHYFLGADAGPYRFEPGNVNHELTASLPGILEHLFAVDHDLFPGPAPAETERLRRTWNAIAAYESMLVRPLLDLLTHRPGVRVLGVREASSTQRVATVGFTVEGRDSAEFPARLDAQGIAIRYGHFYAYRAAEALGILPTNGIVRVSMAHYNTIDEVQRLIHALEPLL